MAEQTQNGHPSELVYLPQPSWYPPLIVAGIAGVLVGMWVWWPYGAVGALVALGSLYALIKESREGFDRLPRHQRVTTAPIPAQTLKRPE